MDYKDLQKALNEVEENWRNYRDKVVETFRSIVTGFARYLKLEYPTKLLQYCPPDLEDYKENTAYTIHGALKFEENGWASLYILLILKEDTNVFPKKRYLLQFMIKQKKGKWLAKGFKDGPILVLNDPITDNDLLQFNDYVSERLYNWLIKGVDNWLKGEDHSVLGFITE